MQKTLKKTAIAAAMLTALAGTAPAKEIPIAVMHALTGPVGFVGTTMANGTILGLEEINNKKLLGEDTIKIVVADTASDRNQAMTLVSKLASDNVLMIIGPTSSIESLASAPVANEKNVPTYTQALSSDIFKSGPWAFKAMVGTDAYMKPVSKYVLSMIKPKTAAIVFDRQNDSTVTQKNFFKDDLVKGGVQIVSEHGILGTDTDFTVIATEIASKKPDIVYVAAQAHVGANVFTQLRQGGVPKTTPFVASMNMAAPTLTKLGGEAVEGVILVGDFAPDGSVGKQSADFIEAYKSRFGTPPDNFAAVGYMQAQVVLSILKKLGPNATREQVRDALTNDVRNVRGVLGTGDYSIGPNRVIEYTPVLLKVEKGAFVGVKQ